MAQMYQLRLVSLADDFRVSVPDHIAYKVLLHAVDESLSVRLSVVNQQEWGQIGTREDHCYEESPFSSLAFAISLFLAATFAVPG